MDERVVTISGYKVMDEDVAYHKDHDPNQDRWDDCPLCWADVTSDRQQAWLMDRGMAGKGNSIRQTMGLLPQA